MTAWLSGYIYDNERRSQKRELNLLVCSNILKKHAVVGKNFNIHKTIIIFQTDDHKGKCTHHTDVYGKLHANANSHDQDDCWDGAEFDSNQTHKPEQLDNEHRKDQHLVTENSNA